jgi:hypothetical protein
LEGVKIATDCSIALEVLVSNPIEPACVDFAEQHLLDENNWMLQMVTETNPKSS